VAKAIVHAVELNGGRFFERDPKTSFWFRVQYKRAVDKTSQGLRERDRDDLHSESMCHDLDDGQVYVPDSFSGKSNLPPNLEALAQVAIDSANRAHSSQPHQQPNQAPVRRTSTKKQPPEQQLLLPGNEPPIKRARILKSSLKSQAADFAVPMQQAARPGFVAPDAYSVLASYSKHSPPFTTGLGALIHQQEALDFPIPVAATCLANDLTPLPPTMQDRESSVFCFLKHTQLLPTLSAFAFDTQPLKLHSKLQRTSEGLTVQPAPPSTRAMPHPSEREKVPTVPTYSEYSTDASGSAKYAELPQQRQPELAYEQQRQPELAYEQQHMPHHHQHQHGNVPSLTRFTSDWLNSFWPTDHQYTGRQDSVQQVQDTAARMAPPPRDNLQQDKVLPATSMTSVVPIKLCTTSASRKRKSKASLPRLPYSVSGGVNNCDDNGNPYPIPLAAVPSEQSVSATLLKLAGSPSRLFSGFLTSFFREAGVSGVVAQQPDLGN
jgi:hypothetical protein